MTDHSTLKGLTSAAFLLAALISSDFRCQAADGPYCGVYAVYGAVCAVGGHGDFESLLDKRFVSGRAGSTVGDIVDAVEHLGARAKPMTGLGLWSLQESRDPLILHVASFGQLDAYNHWLLFLGMESGKARTVDGSGSIHLMDVAELLVRWDGVGVAVFKGSEPKTNFGSAELAGTGWKALLALFAVGMCSLLVCRWSGKRSPSLLSAGIILAVATLLMVTVSETQSGSSLLRNPNCVRFIAAAAELRQFPELTVQQMVDLTTKTNGVVVFDVRYDGDMAYGHIPGAIGLPIDSAQQFVAARLEGLDRTKPVVLYCQSTGCRFSDRMAVALTSFGFLDIRIFRDGWVGWSEFHNSVRPKE